MSDRRRLTIQRLAEESSESAHYRLTPEQWATLRRLRAADTNRKPRGFGRWSGPETRGDLWRTP